MALQDHPAVAVKAMVCSANQTVCNIFRGKPWNALGGGPIILMPLGPALRCGPGVGSSNESAESSLDSPVQGLQMIGTCGNVRLHLSHLAGLVPACCWRDPAIRVVIVSMGR